MVPTTHTIQLHHDHCDDILAALQVIEMVLGWIRMSYCIDVRIIEHQLVNRDSLRSDITLH